MKIIKQYIRTFWFKKENLEDIKGFDFIGCEIDKDYCKIIEERLSQENLSDWTLPENKE